MEMLFHVFVVPPVIIAGVVGVATWNIRSVIISFRVAFFAWPICIYFRLTERPVTGFLIVVLLVLSALLLTGISRVRVPPHQSWGGPRGPSYGGNFHDALPAATQANATIDEND
jgi:hypothetical protein